MKTLSNIVGFEYNKRKDISLSPFETFLKYTDEKEKSSIVLKNILNELFSHKKTTILDIGSGDGTYIMSTLKKTEISEESQIVLLEPSKNLIKKLKNKLRHSSFRNLKIKMVNMTLDHFAREKILFRIIIASHSPINKERLPQTLLKMLNLLRNGGHLIIVLRKKDETYRFRTKFKSHLLNDRNYKSLVIDDALKILRELKKYKPLKIRVFKSDSKLYLPMDKNRKDTISIIEFFLNEKWGNIPKTIQKEIDIYIKRKKGIFRQTDGFVLVTKN